MTDTVLRFRSYERAFITGKTGTGKTYAARYILSAFSRLVVLDPKGTLGGWGLDPWDRERRRRLRGGYPVRTRVLLTPGEDPQEFWEKVLELVFKAGNVTLYIDEVYGVIPPNSTPSPWLTAIWTRGRELGIGGYAASQRPVWVPLFIESEAEHFLMFRLGLPQDRKRMSAFMGPEVLDRFSNIHGLYYSRAEWDKPLFLDRLPIGSVPRQKKQQTSPPSASPVETKKVELAG